MGLRRFLIVAGWILLAFLCAAATSILLPRSSDLALLRTAAVGQVLLVVVSLLGTRVKHLQPLAAVGVLYGLGVIGGWMAGAWLAVGRDFLSTSLKWGSSRCVSLLVLDGGASVCVLCLDLPWKVRLVLVAAGLSFLITLVDGILLH